MYHNSGVIDVKSGHELISKFLERYFGKRGARVVFCLVLMAFGITHTEIQAKYGTSLSTLRRYRKAVESGDLNPLFTVADRVRDRSELDDFEEAILNDFKENPPATLREAQSRIEEITGLKRSLRRVGVWLQKRGFAHWR